MNQCSELIAKIVIIGEAKVGKTSIFSRATEGVFPLNLIPTLGVDYRIKKMKINNQDLKLQLWDTAGQERFRAITQNYYKGSSGIILVFDLTDENSFKTLKQWLDSIQNITSSDIVKIVIGNKSDLTQSIVISDEMIQQFQQTHQLEIFKVSAKDGSGIDEVFDYLAQQIIDYLHSEFLNNNKPSKHISQASNKISCGLRVKSQDEKKKSGCCGK